MARQTTGIARASFLAGLAAQVAIALVPRGILAQEAPVRVATTVTTFFAEPYLATDLGIFRRAGLNVEVTGVGNGEFEHCSGSNGERRYGVAWPPCNWRQPCCMTFRCVSSVTAVSTPRLRRPRGCTSRDSPLRDAKSLEGKTVGVNTVQSTNFLGVQAWLAKRR